MIKRWDSKADWETYFSKDAVIIITPDGKLTEGGNRQGHVIYHYDSGIPLSKWIESRISCECEPIVPPHVTLVQVTFKFAETVEDLTLATSYQYYGCYQPGGLHEFPVDLSSYVGRWISVDFRLLTTDNLLFKSYVDWIEVEYESEPTPPPTFECEDIRPFATICKDVVQDKAIIPKKIDDGEVRQENLWDRGDDRTIENLVKGETTFADDLHGHKAILDMYNMWAKRWYYKKSLYKPQNPPDESTSQAGADLVGYKVKSNTALQPSWNIDNVDEAILALSLLMKGLKERKFPTIQETMHTSGRMLNLTFVPLPDNHTNGKWYDGTNVKESQCSWIVSPSFIWGIDGVPTPWVFSCSTYGVGSGGEYPPPQEGTKWNWEQWHYFFTRIINGNILYGRWLIQFLCAGTTSLFSSLFFVLAVHANYTIVGTHWFGEEEETSVKDHGSYRDENGNYINGWYLNKIIDYNNPDNHYDSDWVLNPENPTIFPIE